MIYRAIVAYDGSRYAGWQKQKNALGIQSVIEKALTKIHKKEVVIVASGRTDAGVHALGQVFHFEALDTMAPRNYEQALNTLLPKDIRIQSIDCVPDDFHARFSAKSKRYDYVCTYDTKDPFVNAYKHVLWKPLDVEAMEEAKAYLIGTHDYTSFSSSHIDERKPRVKTVTRIAFMQEGEDLRTIFEGTGFLRYQVRMMMATLIEVGRHTIDSADVKRILEAKDKHACRYNVEACGLYLVEVNY